MTTWLVDVDGDLVNSDGVAWISVRERTERQGPDGEKVKVTIGYQVEATMMRPISGSGQYGASATTTNLSAVYRTKTQADAHRALLAGHLLTAGHHIIKVE